MHQNWDSSLGYTVSVDPNESNVRIKSRVALIRHKRVNLLLPVNNLHCSDLRAISKDGGCEEVDCAFVLICIKVWDTS